MKHISALFLALATSSLSFASSASPNSPIAKIETSSGIGEEKSVRTITIDRMGRVILNDTASEEKQDLLIMTLEGDLRGALIMSSADVDLSAGLVDLEPSIPSCADTRSTTYSVVPERFLVVLAKRENCKISGPAHNAGSKTLSILQSIETLANSIP